MNIRCNGFINNSTFKKIFAIFLSVFCIFCLVVYSLSNAPKNQTEIYSTTTNTEENNILEVPSTPIEDTYTTVAPPDATIKIRPYPTKDDFRTNRPVPMAIEDAEIVLEWELEEPVRGALGFETSYDNDLIIDVPEDFMPFASWSYNGHLYDFKLDEEWQYYTYQMADKYEVPYRVILGIMGVETGWDVYWGPKNGYVGVGCINEYYGAKSFAKKGIDIYTPKGNIEAICSIIANKLDLWDGNIHYALMAYNGGDNYVKDLIDAGEYSTIYSRKVIEIAKSFG